MLSRSSVPVQVNFGITFRIAAGSDTALIIGARLTVAGAGTSAADRAESITFLEQRNEMKRGGGDSRRWQTFFLLLAWRMRGI